MQGAPFQLSTFHRPDASFPVPRRVTNPRQLLKVSVCPLPPPVPAIGSPHHPSFLFLLFSGP